MTISFEEAAFGKETDIEIPREETCGTCNGVVQNQEQNLKHVNTVMEQDS